MLWPEYHAKRGFNGIECAKFKALAQFNPTLSCAGAIPHSARTPRAENANTTAERWRCPSKQRIKLITIQCVCFLGTYFISAGLAASRGTGTPWITTFLDNAVPFWPAWVWIYLSAYFLATAGLCLAIWGVSERTFRVVLVACYINLFVSTVFHLALPWQAIKPAVATTTLSGSVMAFVQRLTTRWNTFPSLHVSYALITLWAAAKGFQKHKLISIFLIANAALIIPATLFVKEHTAIDVCGGVMVAVLSLITASAIVHVRERDSRSQECTESLRDSQISTHRVEANDL